MYIDIDVHHGDGVEDAFKDSPKVSQLFTQLSQSKTRYFEGLWCTPGLDWSDDVYRMLKGPGGDICMDHPGMAVIFIQGQPM